MQQLPAGLDPVRAGRFGLWLLGQRSHRQAIRRSVSRTRVATDALGDRFLCLFVPWSLHAYPGRKQALAELLGVSRRTAERYTRGELPAKHCGVLERIARQRAADWLALADDLAGKKPQGF